jgi:hypothetical protein
MAALDAMDFGRRLLWATRAVTDVADILTLPQVPTEVLPPVPAGRAPVLSAVGRLAVARFWTSLQDFVCDHSGGPPEGWVLGGSHPFLCISEGGLAVRVV